MDPDAYLAELRREIPGVRVIYKNDDAFSRAIAAALRVVTFGAQSAYMTRYVTTIGRAIYLPTNWDARDARTKYVTLRHEAVHLRQFRRYTLIGMTLLYLIPILPMGLAWGRARLEWEAYAETFRATAEVYGEAAAHDPVLREHVVQQFVGGAYGWMWPFRSQIERWIDDVLATL